MDDSNGSKDVEIHSTSRTSKGLRSTAGKSLIDAEIDEHTASESSGPPLLETLGNAFKAVQNTLSPQRKEGKEVSHVDALKNAEGVVETSNASPRHIVLDIPATAEAPNDGGPSEKDTIVSVQSTSSNSVEGKKTDEPESSQQPAVVAKSGVSAIGANATLAWQGLVGRFQKTLKGSQGDIGWLQADPNLPPVTDRTERFATLLGRIINGVHTLPDSFVYLLVPGLFSNHGPLYFIDAKKHFSKLGLPCHIAKIHSEASVETNAKEVKQYIEELYWGTGKKVIILGHSKGGVDGAAAISMYWDSLKDKVAGIVLCQSPYGGSPVASDLLREGQVWDMQWRQIIEVAVCRVLQGDLTSLDDLTYDRRKKFLADHPLPDSVPCVCFHTEASRAPGVISTLSHIAHADMPWSSKEAAGISEEEALKGKIPVAIPLAAVMAVCAQFLEIRYGAASDGMVARKDAEVPGSAVVRPVRKLDHGWMVYAPVKKDPKEVDAAQMCEALISLLLDCFPQIKANMGVNEDVADAHKAASKTGGAVKEESKAAASGAPSAVREHDEELASNGKKIKKEKSAAMAAPEAGEPYSPQEHNEDLA